MVEQFRDTFSTDRQTHTEIEIQLLYNKDMINDYISGIDEDSSPDMSSPSTPVHKESPTKCLLNNNKFNERKREYELRRRKKEEEMAKT